MRVEEVDYQVMGDDDFAGINALENAMQAETDPDDPPRPVELTRAELQNIPRQFQFCDHLARDHTGEIIASASIWWRDSKENRHFANVSLDVHPVQRRRGIARELLRVTAPVAEADGRTLLGLRTNERVPAGEEFVRRLGAKLGMAVHSNRLLIGRVDRDLVRKWVDDGPNRAPGYSLLPIDGRFPDDLIEEIARVWGVMNTAPRDDLEVEDEYHPPEHIREMEAWSDVRRAERWALFARHDATGRLVGLTEVSWSPYQPLTVWQGDTGVEPPHRGHALGKWLKATMLERIMRERPGVVDVRTGNADSNDAMLGINRALGFEPFWGAKWWQVRLDRVKDYLAGSSS